MGAWSPQTTHLRDGPLATWIGAVLFCALAWPLLFFDVAPYQDLPIHLAVVTVIGHPAHYPELVFNGFLKTNSALYAWLYFGGKLVGVKGACRLAALLTLAAMAFALPRFVLEFRGRRAMLVASLFFAPMVHNWWVSMGMLNFAFSLAVALEILVQLHRQRTRPTILRSGSLVGLSALAWYAHNLPLFVVGALVLVEVIAQPSWPTRRDMFARLLLPLAPVGLLALGTAVAGFGAAQAGLGTTGSGEGLTFEPLPWLVYDLWAHFFYGFTILSASSLVTAVALACLASRHARDRIPFFSPLCVAVPLAATLFLPAHLPSWGFVNVRFLPFVWFAALTRLPEALPSWLAKVLAASAALYVGGMCVDLFRVYGDQREFMAGVVAVPEGARLLTLNFATRVTSRNTWSLDNASGLYTLERETPAQDAGAHRSPTRFTFYPLSFRRPPDFYADRYALRKFARTMGSRASYCSLREESGLGFGEDASACPTAYASAWIRFWEGATPRFDHVAIWGGSEDVLAQVPPAYHLTFAQGRMQIFERVSP